MIISMANLFARFLSSAGVDAVKTDAQFFLDLLDDRQDRKRFIKAYQDAWTVSSLRYFSVKAISCMINTLVHPNQLLTKAQRHVANSADHIPFPTSHQ